MFPNLLKDAEVYAEHAKPHFEHAGLTVAEAWHNGRISYKKLETYAKICNLKGIVHLPSGTQTTRILPNGTPMVFMDEKLVHPKGSVEEIASHIREATEGKDGPHFIVVYCAPTKEITLKFEDILMLLDPEQYEPVRLDTMFELILQNEGK